MMPMLTRSQALDAVGDETIFEAAVASVYDALDAATAERDLLKANLRVAEDAGLDMERELVAGAGSHRTARDRKMGEAELAERDGKELRAQLAAAEAAWAALMDKALTDERARVEKLEAFKTYVHGRLDQAGVPADPQPEENAKHGCRIEGRLNYVLAYARASAMMPTRRAPPGGCWVKCPRCTRVGPCFIEEGEAVGYCAQCALGERVRADLVDCPAPAEPPA